MAELVALMKTSSVTGSAGAFDTLLANGALVKIGDDVYRGSQIAAIHVRLESTLSGGRRFTVSEFGSLTGTSRKYAVPLSERSLRMAQVRARVVGRIAARGDHRLAQHVAAGEHERRRQQRAKPVRLMRGLPREDGRQIDQRR